MAFMSGLADRFLLLLQMGIILHCHLRLVVLWHHSAASFRYCWPHTWLFHSIISFCLLSCSRLFLWLIMLLAFVTLSILLHYPAVGFVITVFVNCCLNEKAKREKISRIK